MKYSDFFWIILHLVIIILLFPALYSFDIYIRIISPVLNFPTLEENLPTVRGASCFLYGRIISVVQKHNLLCSFEQRIHLKWIVAPCPFIAIK